MTISANTADFARTFQDYLDCFVVVGGTEKATRSKEFLAQLKNY